MNLQEKVQLIKEIHVLTHQLEHRALSFYETALSKRRIHEIFALCDEPIFQKQILSYRALTEPQMAATEFAKQTPYSWLFRGYFNHDAALESALYQYPEMGWALLHDHELGWQVWMIPAKQRTALLSEWGNFSDCYDWLIEQQQLYKCLISDTDLRLHALRLKDEIISAPSCVAASVDNLLPIEAINKDGSVDLDHCDKQINKADTLLDNSNTNKPELSAPDTVPLVLIEQPTHAPSEEHLNSTTADVELPEQIQIAQYTARVQTLQNIDAQLALYELQFMDQPELTTQLDVLLHTTDGTDWKNQPLYLAEQINTEGRFIKYLLLFGAQTQMEAIRLSQLFCQQHQHELAAIKVMTWDNLEQLCAAPDQLYQQSQQAEMIWSQNDYYPFIPAQLIHTQKFIHFDEPEPTLHTPLLLLQERQKIRLIHGQKRMALLRTEQALPYLILHRQQGLNWQSIQNVIQQLPQPIDVISLYQALKQMTED